MIYLFFYWMHGGGMMGGTPEQDDGQMNQIAVEANVLVVSVDYRVAPEFPFPIPLSDCYEGLKSLVKHSEKLGIDAGRIAVGGASAGGGLAASLALKIKNDPWVKLFTSRSPTRCLTTETKQIRATRLLL